MDEIREYLVSVLEEYYGDEYDEFFKIVSEYKLTLTGYFIVEYIRYFKGKIEKPKLATLVIYNKSFISYMTDIAHKKTSSIHSQLNSSYILQYRHDKHINMSMLYDLILFSINKNCMFINDGKWVLMVGSLDQIINNETYIFNYNFNNCWEIRSLIQTLLSNYYKKVTEYDKIIYDEIDYNILVEESPSIPREFGLLLACHTYFMIIINRMDDEHIVNYYSKLIMKSFSIPSSTEMCGIFLSHTGKQYGPKKKCILCNKYNKLYIFIPNKYIVGAKNMIKKYLHKDDLDSITKECIVKFTETAYICSNESKITCIECHISHHG